MKKKAQVHYTNEKLSKMFESNFELVNYSIRLAENMVKSGREPRVKSATQNRAMLILEEIFEGKDQFDEIDGDASTSTHSTISHADETRNDRKRPRTANSTEE